MDHNIKIKIEIDKSLTESEVIIRASEESDFIKNLADSVRHCIEREQNERLSIEVVRDSKTISVEQPDIIRVFSEYRRIVVWTREGGFQAKCTLKELEATLNRDWFIRISRFEIINLNIVSGFDMSIKGTMKVTFEDGSYSWVSRRFLLPVQQRLSELARKGGERYE